MRGWLRSLPEDGTRGFFGVLSCCRTSVTVLPQDIGDTSGGVGGDTCEDGWRVWPMSVRVRVCLSGEENQ